MDFADNPLRIFAAHELAAMIDPAMTTKMTVQVGAAGSTFPPFGNDNIMASLMGPKICDMSQSKVTCHRGLKNIALQLLF